jgi:hypothetical protein
MQPQSIRGVSSRKEHAVDIRSLDFLNALNAIPVALPHDRDGHRMAETTSHRLPLNIGSRMKTLHYWHHYDVSPLLAQSQQGKEKFNILELLSHDDSDFLTGQFPGHLYPTSTQIHSNTDINRPLMADGLAVGHNLL